MADTKKDFAKKFTELEQIVAWFETDSVDIDASLQKFERGMKLSQELKKELQAIENKVEKIKADFSSD